MRVNWLIRLMGLIGLIGLMMGIAASARFAGLLAMTSEIALPRAAGLAMTTVASPSLRAAAKQSLLAMTGVAHAATATSTSFKSADSEAVIFGGLATSTSFRNVGAGGQPAGDVATSNSFKHEIGILYFEPPATPTPAEAAAGGGGTLFLEGEEEIAAADKERLLRRSAEAELLAMTIESLRDFFASLRARLLAGEAIPVRLREIFFPPKPPELLPIEGVVLAMPPLSLSGQWILLPARAIKEFALAPLPRDIRMLAQKFPEVQKTLGEVGVRKITDVEKLRDVVLELPGLSEAAGVAEPMGLIRPISPIGPIGVEDLGIGRFALPSRVPLAELSLEYKRQIPPEFVFVRAGGELIDMKTVLSLNEKGEVEQRVFAVAGKVLHLSVKPKGDAKSVKGYLVYKGEKKGSYKTNEADRTDRTDRTSIEAKDLVASALFAGPGAEPAVNGGDTSYPRDTTYPDVESISVSTELVIAEFEYTDPDGDGIWTAEVQAPVVEGEYETITLIDYIDPEKGRQAVRLITVVDPEGYVFEWDGDRQTRVAGAIISLYWLNPATSEYELWQAEKYLQKNPQVTDVTGKYAFLTPEGTYYLKVEAPGYLAYEGKSFVVEEGRGIHFNVDLKTAVWWLKMIDWKWITMLLLFLLVAYNYYKDARVKQWIRR